MAGDSVNRDMTVHAPFASNGQGVVGTSDFQVQGVQGAFCLVEENLAGDGSGMADFFISAENNLDWPFFKPQMTQSLNDIQHNNYAALHVDDARAVGGAVLDVERVFRKTALRKDGVDMAAHDNRSARAFRPVFGDKYIRIALRINQTAPEALGLETVTQKVNHAVYPFLLFGIPLHIDKRFPQFNHFLPAFPYKLFDGRHIALQYNIPLIMSENRAENISTRNLLQSCSKREKSTVPDSFFVIGLL